MHALVVHPGFAILTARIVGERRLGALGVRAAFLPEIGVGG